MRGNRQNHGDIVILLAVVALVYLRALVAEIIDGELLGRDAGSRRGSRRHELGRNLQDRSLHRSDFLRSVHCRAGDDRLGQKILLARTLPTVLVDGAIRVRQNNNGGKGLVNNRDFLFHSAYPLSYSQQNLRLEPSKTTTIEGRIPALGFLSLWPYAA